MDVERCRGERLGGTLTRWHESRGDASALVVELGRGPLGRGGRRAHLWALDAVIAER